MLNDAMMNESVIDKNTSQTESPDLDKLLEIAIKRRTEEFIPLIVFFIIATSFGIIGNSLTIWFYGFKAKRNTTFVLIALLSAFDIVVCFLCYGHIAGMFLYILVTYKSICKAGFFLFNWFVRSSILALCVTAIDRYRHMCKYGKKQMTVKLAVRTVIGMSVVSMIYSTHTLLTNDSMRVNIRTSDNEIPYVSVYSCKTTKEPALQPFVKAIHIIDILFFSAVIATLVFTYGKILWTYRTHNKNTAYLHKKPTAYFSQQSACSNEVHQHDSDKHKGKAGELSRDSLVSVDLDKESAETLTTSVTARCSTGAESQAAATNYSAKDQMSIRALKISQSERKLTKLIFAVNVGFYFCFIPYLLLQAIFAQASKDTVAKSEGNVAGHFALRLPFLNSMINPFICFAFHEEFRRNVKDIFTKFKP